MVQIQVRVTANADSKEASFELDLLSREDTTEVERRCGAFVEETFTAILEAIPGFLTGPVTHIRGEDAPHPEDERTA